MLQRGWSASRGSRGADAAPVDSGARRAWTQDAAYKDMSVLHRFIEPSGKSPAFHPPEQSGRSNARGDSRDTLKHRRKGAVHSLRRYPVGKRQDQRGRSERNAQKVVAQDTMGGQGAGRGGGSERQVITGKPFC